MVSILMHVIGEPGLTVTYEGPNVVQRALPAPHSGDPFKSEVGLSAATPPRLRRGHSHHLGQTAQRNVTSVQRVILPQQLLFSSDKLFGDVAHFCNCDPLVDVTPL